MDRLKKQRAPERATVTRLVTSLEQKIGESPIDKFGIETTLESLEDHLQKLIGLDERVKEALLDSYVSEDEFQSEVEGMDSYVDKVRIVKRRVSLVLRPTPPPSPTHSEGSSSFHSLSTHTRKTIRYPKIELKTFSGELTEWLGWWAQFQKIDGDEELDESDKFTYLAQSMAVGTRASELVKSYPQSKLNYPKVIQALKDRYGKPKLLKQVYVRELISMITASRTRERMGLATLFDKLESHLRSLESLGVTVEQMVEFLFPMVESCLPEDILLAWQRSGNFGVDGSKLVPPKTELDFLMSFLKQEIDHEEQRKLARNGFGVGDKKTRRRDFGEFEEIPTAAGLFSGSSSPKPLCLFCDKGGHDSKDCFRAQKMNLEDKKAKVSERKACFACLRLGHHSKNCHGNSKCPVCGRKHPVVMCPEVALKRSQEGGHRKSESTPTIPTNISALNCTSEVILRTLMVQVQNPITRKVKRVRVLIDCGSQRSHILKKTAAALGLVPIGSVTLNHQLFGGSELMRVVHQVYDVTLCAPNGTFVKTVRILDQKEICGTVPRVPRGEWLTELQDKGIQLSDFDPKDPTEIELMIGGDILGGFLTGKIEQLQNGLTATETQFGWSVMGHLKTHTVLNNLAMSVLSMTVSSSSVSDLWNLDTLGIRDPIEVKSQEEIEQQTLHHFTETVTRDSEGRYSVSLPWIDEGMTIPTNKAVAYKRLENTTRKLVSMGKVGDYGDIFHSWETEGIISKVDPSSDIVSGRVHYLPHRAVLKPESKTTPIRPVFDASCKNGRAPSLNDCLQKGPNLLELIPSILLRFRMGKIGVISDIRKAFLMVEINQRDRDSVRFLWWEDLYKKSLVEYRHNRVVFGMNCSPFLLGATINHHLSGYEEDYPEVVAVLRSSLYVDNCVHSVENLEEYEKFKSVSTQILADAQMELRQWEYSGDREEEQLTNVLGLRWDKSEDSLMCAPLSSDLPPVITKRVILSKLHHIFDPLGFLSPTLIVPKVILQKTWAENRKWEDELPGEVTMEFIKWWQEMIPLLSSFRIPRNCTGGVKHEDGNLQLHIFCDASKTAYAVVIFLRVELNGKISVQMLESKSRVTPVKKTSTIPRLELLSCSIAARLGDTVKKALAMEKTPTFYWSDSTTALSWIKRSDVWGTFVGNRVREILTLSEVEKWNHVPGELNPADLPSRGVSPKKFSELKWWEGPAWLKLDKSEWPRSDTPPDEREVQKERKHSVILSATSASAVPPWYIVRNSYSLNLHIFALVIRFCDLLQKRTQVKGWFPTTKEITTAELRLFKIVQLESFDVTEEVIGGIRVIVDSGGILRAKTKLLNRQDSPGFKFPVLLPHSHPVVDLLIREEHWFHCHGGVQFLMGRLREKYWILQGRLSIQKVLRKCVKCQRFTSKRTEVPFSALPEDRVKDAEAFEVTGVDLAGPLMLRNETKVWIVLFTCGVYRGIHLELVESLSTEDFLLAFTRFCWRKRRPEIVYSDCGTNFEGAENLFKGINWEEVQQRTKLPRRIVWKFNPPSAPWWGGWWERLIRSVKDLLKRMLGFGKLSHAELETCLCQVESVINHRPLTFVTEDSEDLVPLTPSMFFYRMPTSDVPEAMCVELGELRNKIKTMDKMAQELKERFRMEYLGLLVQRGKEKRTRDLTVGDFVLVGSDDRKRVLWPMARILELIPGKDGVHRVARVKTKTGILIRPLQRLFPLEFEKDEPLFSVVQEKATHSVKKKGKVTRKEENEEPTTDQVKVTQSGRVIRKPQKFCVY